MDEEGEDVAGEQNETGDGAPAETGDILQDVELLDTSGWETYRNEEWGFEMRYPGEWTVYVAPDGNPYINDLSDRVVLFYNKRFPWNNMSIKYAADEFFVYIELDRLSEKIPYQNSPTNELLTTYVDSNDMRYVIVAYNNPQNLELSKKYFDGFVATFRLL